MLSALSVGTFGCKQQQEDQQDIYFTKTDSLTDIYLSLQDSLHTHWNLMINDDNHKLNAMHSLLHELMVTHPEEMDQYAKFEERLEQLSRMRYTQKSMANEHVVEEYDFATNALIIELITITESTREYSYNSTMQKLVDHILTADQDMTNYRIAYDSIVYAFNTFIEENREHLEESGQDLPTEKRPQFQMASGN
jgi:hypothetical protein